MQVLVRMAPLRSARPRAFNRRAVSARGATRHDAFLGSRSCAGGKVVTHRLSSVKYLSLIRQLLFTAF